MKGFRGRPFSSEGCKVCRAGAGVLDFWPEDVFVHTMGLDTLVLILYRARWGRTLARRT